MRDSTARHFRNVESLPEATSDPDKPQGRVRVMVLASGSKGNCILLAYGNHALLIDAGLTEEETRSRARSVGCPVTSYSPVPGQSDGAMIEAVLLTHWHSDHKKYSVNLCRKFNCPMVASTATKLGLETEPWKFTKASQGDCLSIGSQFEVFPLKVPHEEGSLAFHIRVGSKNIILAHDLAEAPSALLAAVRSADCLLIETNHNPEKVAACQNPGHSDDLHKRILSHDRGHLSNAQATEVISHVDPSRIQAICALHVSDSHNTPEEAEEAIRAGIPASARPVVYVARQDSAVLMEVNGGPSPLELSLVEQFRRLDKQVDAVIGEQQRADAETADRRIVLGEYMAQMRELFDAKDPGATLEGFQFFDHWKVSKAKKYGVSERTMNYYLLDAETVVPKIGRDVARALPLGAISELGKMAKVKGDISPATLQFAQEHTAIELKAHVASILWPGKTGHFEGPEEHLSVTCGKKQAEAIRKKFDVARPFVDPRASDADVIEYALEEFIQAHQQEAKQDEHAEEITDILIGQQPVPPPPDFDDIVALSAEEEHPHAR